MGTETATADARKPRACVAYYRVSTEGQGRSGLGLEAQHEAVAAFLRSGACSRLVEEFTEVESGRNDGRPELRKALAAARKRDARLVVAKLDRLGRRAAHVLRILDESDVDVVIADMPSAGPLVLGILASVAEDEARRISERTKAALAAAKARGTELGTPENLQHADPREGARASAAVRSARADRRARDLEDDIEQLRAEGRTSLRALADGLNERGLRTARGCEWSANAVRRVLMRLEGPE